jgi:CubicO group peptidase (beta-lactamase class C family)
LLVWVAAAGEARAQACDFTQVDAALANLVTAVAQVPGAGIRIGTSEEILHEAYFGTYDANTVVRTGSSAKLLSAATVLSTVDDGLVGLDQPVSSILPAFTGAKADMTLRQMFSHTSGMPGGSNWSVLSDDTLTLAEAVDQIACCIAIEAPPHTQFSYGGLSMHIGGRMIEVVDGRLWDDLFAARIADPLGFTVTDYEGLGVTDNPRIAGGARTNLHDYGVFLEMLLRGGYHEGQQILSLASVDEIFKDQQHGLPIVAAPDGVGQAGYGLGLWRESFDPSGSPIRVSDAGAFGLTPWIEMDRRVYGIIMVDWFRAPLLPALEGVQNLVRAELDRCDARGPAPPAIPLGGAMAHVVIALVLSSIGARFASRSARTSGARAGPVP